MKISEDYRTHSICLKAEELNLGVSEISQISTSRILMKIIKYEVIIELKKFLMYKKNNFCIILTNFEK